MTDDSIHELRAEYERLASALDATPGAAERVAVKNEIVNLFRRTEGAIGELAAFKESIRELVDRFKTLPATSRLASVRHDHIGASTYLERGWSELAGANWTAAEVMLRQAVELDQTSLAAQALLAWSLVHQGRCDEAIAGGKVVLARDPGNGLAHVALGMALLRTGSSEAAIEHLTMVVTRGGDSRAMLYAHYWLGVAYLERELHSDAEEFLRRALALGPNLSEGWAELGRALWFVGRPQDAEEAWAVGSRVRHSPHAARCAAMLESTKGGGAPPRTILH